MPAKRTKARKQRRESNRDEKYLKDLGDKIRAAREAKGLSQSALATAAGIHQPTAQRIEAGKADPSTAKIQRIAGALGVSVDSLLPALSQVAT